MNILVLCTGNSARSILLESILRNVGAGRVASYSAGSQPKPQVHPQTLKLLAEKGYPTEGLRSKSWDEFGKPDAPVMDAVITVCGSAAGETCPMWPGAPVRAHWGVEDPAAAAPEAQEAAFLLAYTQLHARAKALFALPFETLTPEALRQTLVRIGQTA